MTLTEMPLRKIAAEHPAAVHIFDRFEIDLCQNGDKSLAEACADLHLSADQVQEKIFTLTSFSKLAGDPDQLTLTQLIQRIVRTHHRRIRQDLPALVEMAVRLEKIHTDNRPEHGALASLVKQVHREMFEHIGREEQVLFPFIARMEEESRLSFSPDHTCFQSVRKPISRLLQDHECSRQIFDELRQRTNDFNPPASACGTKRALFAGLEAFDADNLEHLHIENDILFPRAITLEAELSAKVPAGSHL